MLQKLFCFFLSPPVSQSLITFTQPFYFDFWVCFCCQFLRFGSRLLWFSWQSPKLFLWVWLAKLREAEQSKTKGGCTQPLCYRCQTLGRPWGMLFRINPMATLKVTPRFDVPSWEYNDLMMVLYWNISLMLWLWYFVIMTVQCVMCRFTLGMYWIVLILCFVDVLILSWFRRTPVVGAMHIVDYQGICVCS